MASNVAVGVALALVAIAVRALLDPLLGNKFALSTCFYAVLAAAWWRGTIAGLSAAAVGISLGAYFWMEPRGSLRVDLADDRLGVVLAFIAFVVISFLGGAHRRSTRRARDRAHELQTLLDIVPGGVVTADPECRRITGNRAFHEMLGLAEGANASISAEDTDVPAGTRVVRDGRDLTPDEFPMQYTGRTGRPVNDFDHTAIFPDGRTVTMLANTAPLLDEQGDVRGVIGSYTDLTRRNRADEELRRAEQLLRSVVNNVIDAIVTIDERGAIESFNPAAERLFGYTTEEVIGENVTILMPDSYRPEHAGAIESYLRTGIAKVIGIGREVVGRRKDGSTFPMDLAVAEFRAFPGDKRHFTGVVRDITARKEAEQGLARHQQHLEELVEQRTAELMKAQQQMMLVQRMAAVGTLAAGLGHDLNNLLLPLGMRMDGLLLSPSLTDDVREELVVINALYDHLRQLSRNLSLFSRDPEKDGIEGRTEIASWSDQVSKLIDASVGQGIAIRWDCPDGLPHAAIAPHRLTQAVQNLVHNARDAIAAKQRDRSGSAPQSEKGRITVEARAARDRASIILDVRDNGCGMSEEIRKRCLEPFYTTKDRPLADGAAYAGSGLGLSLAHQIIERTGGTMSIVSAPGTGTTITLNVPAVR